MDPDRQKVWTDGQKDGRNGRTDGWRQNYILPTFGGDKKGFRMAWNAFLET